MERNQLLTAAKDLGESVFLGDIFSQSSGVSGWLGMQLHHHKKMTLCKIIERENVSQFSRKSTAR